MKSLTLHDIEDEVYRRLLTVATEQSSSLNKTAQLVMKKGLGIVPSRKKRDLSWLFDKKWTKKEANEFGAAIAEEERVNPQDWQ